MQARLDRFVNVRHVVFTGSCCRPISAALDNCPKEKPYLTNPRSLEDLITPRPVMMPSPEVFDVDLAEIERTIRQTVPVEVRKRLGVSRSLAVYGAFCYDFVSVSAFWSLTCVEMALWEKFAELHPGTSATHKRSTFGSLAKWASDQKLVPDAAALDAMVKLRNSFAHPKTFSPVWNPAMTVTIFQGAVDIINGLWPLDHP